MYRAIDGMSDFVGPIPWGHSGSLSRVVVVVFVVVVVVDVIVDIDAQAARQYR